MDNVNKNPFINWRIIIIFVLLLTGISFVFSVFQTAKYQSHVKVIVIPKLEKNFDPYTSSKSAEYIAGILNEVIYSSAFLKDVLNSGFYMSDLKFSDNPITRSFEWEKMIEAFSANQKGILEINVYHPGKYQAEQIASAISYVLVNKGNTYHGSDSVEVRVIDPPITSKDPVTPNILLNLVVGAILGFMAGIGFVYLFPDYDFTFKKGKKEEIENIIKPEIVVKPEVKKEDPPKPKEEIRKIEVPMVLPVLEKKPEVKQVAMSPVSSKVAPPPANLPSIKQHMNVKDD